jgi:hypothetical protein
MKPVKRLSLGLPQARLSGWPDVLDNLLADEEEELHPRPAPSPVPSSSSEGLGIVKWYKRH